MVQDTRLTWESTVFLNTSNKTLKIKINHIIYNDIKSIKYLRDKFNKNVQNIAEKDLNKQRDKSCLWIRRPDIVKMPRCPALPKLILPVFNTNIF